MTITFVEAKPSPVPDCWAPLYESRPGDEALSVWDGDAFRAISWSDWRRAAHRSAAGLRRLGVVPGSRVACVLTNTADACAGAIGVWLAGGTIVSLPTPARGMSPQAYGDQIRRICIETEAELVLVDAAFVDALAGIEGLLAQPASYESLGRGDQMEPEPPAGPDLAFVQFSSGSTSSPRGCRLTMRAIQDQLDMMVAGLALDPPVDRGVSWLPLSHDLGFFGGLMLAFFRGMPLAVSPPERFLSSPATWFEDCAAFGATITAGPNFALELATRAARVTAPPRFPMRNCVLGGERIEPETLRGAVDALGPSGLTARSLMPAYGMAEAVLAVTMTPYDREPAFVRAVSEPLFDGRLELAGEGESEEGTVELVSSGRPLPRAAVEIASWPQAVGEVAVRTPSLASGYIGGDPEAGDRFRDGAFLTGDVGFVRNGELYVAGRLDDMLSVAGRKVWARDVEAAVGRLDGVRRGNCALVDVHEGGRVRLALLLEPGSAGTGYGRLARRAAGVAMEAGGVRVEEVVVVPPRTIPKTPSGKLSRYRCRSLAADCEARALARVEP